MRAVDRCKLALHLIFLHVEYNVSKCTYFAIVTNSVRSLEFECNNRNYGVI